MHNFGKKVLIVVPHQDDEILMTGGIIRQSLLNNLDVKVIIATNGDYMATTYEKGQQRIRESIKALSLIGLPSENIIFLGYPDTGMSPSESFISQLYACESPHQLFASTCSNFTYGIPGIAEDYHYTQTGNHALYTRHHFYHDLESIFLSFKADTIFVTSQYDKHGDHKGLFHFTIDILKDLKQRIPNYCPILYEGLVHSPSGDLVWPSPNIPGLPLSDFSMPPTLEDDTSLQWENRISFMVPSEMRVANLSHNLKHQALLAYTTALNPEEPEVVRYLLSFVKNNEFFWKVDI